MSAVHLIKSGQIDVYTFPSDLNLEHDGSVKPTHVVGAD